ncbi:MAG: 1-acyl-sn-glycerol-3-phosphate acyltransferase [Actinomycetota bacterium]|nr:1-acyl-sn-glycerol-3-phosphate acyltransferase [Actinomycetota bacterium]
MSTTFDGHRSGAERFARALAPVLELVVRTLFSIRVVGADRVPAGSVLFAANHVSFLDPVVAAVVLHRLGRTARFLAASELFRKPIVGWVLRRAGQIPVVRGRGAEAMTEAACEALDAGQAVVVYPEGTIPQPGECPPAKQGAGLLALRTSAPVIPVAMWGMQRHERWRGSIPIRRPAGVVFGEPLDLSAWRGRDDADAADQVSQAMLAAVRGLLPVAQRLTRDRS